MDSETFVNSFAFFVPGSRSERNMVCSAVKVRIAGCPGAPEENGWSRNMSVSVATMQMAKQEWANHTPLELIVYILKTLSCKLYFITCSI